MILAAAITQPGVPPVAINVPDVNVSTLESDVRTLSEVYFPRSFESPKLTRAADFIRWRFESTGAAVTEQRYTVQGEEFRNVIASFGPPTGRLVVVGAHYDSYADVTRVDGTGKLNDPETHTPGADDNASGVAGLLELARLLAAHPPKSPVQLVAYTLEEPPHFGTEDMGSAHHARLLADQRRPVRIMLSLEMIGYFSDADESQRFPLPGLGILYPHQGNFVAVIGRFADWRETRLLKAAMSGASDLPVRSMNAFANVPGVGLSDQLSYWNEGFPALMITDTAYARNAGYHASGDRAEKLDYLRMGKVVAGVYAAILQFDP